MDGKLENIGAYRRLFHGTWTQGGQKGEFTLRGISQVDSAAGLSLLKDVAAGATNIEPSRLTTDRSRPRLLQLPAVQYAPR